MFGMVEFIANHVLFPLTILIGIGALTYGVVWLYGQLFALLLTIFKIHKTFIEFIVEKRRKKVHIPKLKEWDK